MSLTASEHPVSSSNPALPVHASPSSTGLANDASQHPEEPKKGGSWLRVLIIILLVGGAIGFVVYRIVTNKPKETAGPGGRRGGGAGQIVPVAYDVATLKTMPISLQALGTVTAYNTVTLRSRVDGQITRVNFTEGQRVKQGQLLIEIDPRPYEAALAQAKGNLVRDQANAVYAQAQAQRYTQLYQAGVVSKESTQTQESTAGQAVGTLAADKAAIEAAQVNLNYTRITSPINGVVGLRQVDVGNIVSASSTTGLVVITQVQPISVIFTLPEDQIPQVFSHMRGGQKLVAEAWDRSNSQKLATGSLLTVDNQIDTTTGTAKLKAVFQNEGNELYPNQFVNIHLILENRPNSLVIPAAAIQTGNGGTFVYAIDRTKGQANPVAGGGAGGGAGRGGRNGGGNANGGGANAPAGGANTAAGPGSPDANASGGAGGQRAGQAGGGARPSNQNFPVDVVQVVVDSTQGTNVILRSGLKAGAQVVTDGQEKLQPGSRVIPRPSDDMQAARKAAQNADAQKSNPNPGKGDFSNGRDSDVSPAMAPGRGRGQAAGSTDSSGLGTSHGPNQNREGANGQMGGQGSGRRRPQQ
ncbi:efflux RND transporter periplasmic adaptor subunit [Terriglobus sp. TAA 43]|uniref:efflux RND transporter periplasmic adaptor subunit n=1 Tax=Terriglobus sp. TAA 43 TaxID=278961 RepID=UPI00068D96FC|nr:efflux RND transporter periplasmic adaptor subunit [Terriglobus sp. TAA 43]